MKRRLKETLAFYNHMNKILQISLLILILIIPLGIILFLNAFGDNRYDIPVYYQKNYQMPFEECGTSAGPHYISNFNGHSKLNASIFFEPVGGYNTTDLKNINNRLTETLHETLAVNIFATRDIGYEKVTVLDPEVFNKWRHCEFITDTLNQFILTDTEGKIRGYYGLELKDIDRLIVETKILMENDE